MFSSVEIIVVTTLEHNEQLSRFLREYIPIDDKIKIELIPIPSDNITGSADYIRAISNKIHGDFIVVADDVVSEVNLAQLTRLHRLKAADVTAMLTPYQHEDEVAEKGDKKGKSEKKARDMDEEDKEYIGRVHTVQYWDSCHACVNTYTYTGV